MHCTKARAADNWKSGMAPCNAWTDAALKQALIPTPIAAKYPLIRSNVSFAIVPRFFFVDQTVLNSSENKSKQLLCAILFHSMIFSFIIVRIVSIIGI